MTRDTRYIELLWDFALSDKCQVLLIERRGDLLVLVGEVSGHGERIANYAERLKALALRKNYHYVKSHMPAAAHLRSWNNGQTPAERLEELGFRIEPWVPDTRKHIPVEHEKVGGSA